MMREIAPGLKSRLGAGAPATKSASADWDTGKGEHVQRADTAGGVPASRVGYMGSAALLHGAFARDIYRAIGAECTATRAELIAIGGVEDDKFVAEDATILANYDECLAFVKDMPNLAVFAPAIGTAHGFYKGQPKIAYDLLERITASISVPIALHGGTGLSQGQFDRCIAGGCAKVNISTMHKHRFIEGFVAVRADKPKLEEPLPFIVGQYDAMKKDVIDMIRIFGSAGKAAHAAGA